MPTHTHTQNNETDDGEDFRTSFFATFFRKILKSLQFNFEIFCFCVGANTQRSFASWAVRHPSSAFPVPGTVRHPSSSWLRGRLSLERKKSEETGMAGEMMDDGEQEKDR